MLFHRIRILHLAANIWAWPAVEFRSEQSRSGRTDLVWS